MPKKNSKTINQPDQLEMSFAQKVWAHSADLNHIGLISLTITLAGLTLAFTGVVAEEFLLGPALILLALVAVVTSAEIFRSLRVTERKGIFIVVYVLASASTFMTLGYLSFERNDLASRRAFDLATSAKDTAEQKIKAWKDEVLEEARAAEVARRAEEECGKARTVAVDSARARRSDAAEAVKACRTEFDGSLFHTQTVEAYCKMQRGKLQVAADHLRSAEALACPPATTGSLKKSP